LLRGVFPPLLWSFPPSATLTSFPAPGCWAHAPTPARASPARPGLFIYNSGKDFLPPFFGAQYALPSLLRVLIAYYSVSLFPRVEVGLSRGLCCSGPGLSVGNRGTTKLTWSTSSQAVWGRASGGPGALLVSPFNVKWRFSAPAGDVEESKLCLFSVIMPAKCVSSVSPRFHSRRLAFCLLPLAAIWNP
jgi:hypothetical protein